MPDSRFFQSLGPISVAELAQHIGARLPDGVSMAASVVGVAPLARAGAEDIAFFSDRRYAADLTATQAGFVLVTEANLPLAPEGCLALVSPEPQAAYARASGLLHRAITHAQGAAAIHPDCELEDGVVIDPGGVIGQNARIGAGSHIGANTVIGPGVCIGRDCQIGPNASISFALIGDRVRIYSGAVIGAEGFGVTGSRQGAVDIPQLGRVIIQDDVTVGANTCIDRGAWGDTVIGERTKIDNMVQIAHNVQIGRNCLIAAHTGISGSTIVGDGVMFGGQAGVVDHVSIGPGARVGAAAGVTKSIPAGETWSGVPARPVVRLMREIAWVARNSDKAARGRKKEGGDER